MASEIRVDKINSLSGVGTVTLSPTGVDIAGITTAATLRATTGIVTSLTAGSLTSLGAVSGTTGTFSAAVSGTTGTFSSDVKSTAGIVDIRSGSSINTNVTGGSASGTLHKNTTSGEFAIVSGGTGGNNHLSFYTSASAAPTEKLRIKSTGEVGIGNNNPSELLSLKNTSAQCNMSLQAATNGECAIFLGDTDSVVRSAIKHHNTGDYLAFFTGGNTERLRINSSGYVGVNEASPQATLHVEGHNITNGTVFLEPHSSKGNNISHIHHGSTGNWYIRPADAAGYIYHDIGKSQFTNGVLFGSDTAAANTLDDYEEGTWTPDWRGASALGTTTYGSYNVASYVKIGNQVTIRGYSELNGSSGGSGFWFINNLPFLVGGGDDRRYRSVGSVMIENFNLPNDVLDVVLYIERNNNDAQLRGIVDNATSSANISVNNDTNFEIYFTATYPTV